MKPNLKKKLKERDEKDGYEDATNGRPMDWRKMNRPAYIKGYNKGKQV